MSCTVGLNEGSVENIESAPFFTSDGCEYAGPEAMRYIDQKTDANKNNLLKDTILLLRSQQNAVATMN